MKRPVLTRAMMSTLVLAGALSLVELGAHIAEPALRPARSTPLPSPHADGAAAFALRAEEARRAQGLAEPPELGGVAFEQDPLAHQPLVEDVAGNWGLPPGATWQKGNAVYRINSLGLRGGEIMPLVAGERRILSMGDSSVFGDGVREEEVFSSVAAAKLRALGATAATGVIGAIPGFDSGQSLQLLRKVGKAVRPTWVVIANIWSDLYNKDPKLAQPVGQARDGLRRLASYRLLRGALAPWLVSQKVGWIDGVADVSDGQGHPGRTSLALYSANLDGMAAEAVQLGARPIFVLLPAPMDFDTAPPPPMISVYRDAVQAAAARAGAPVVDGTEVFRAHGGGVADFFDQVHPTPRGHRLLGEALADAIWDAGE